MKKQRTKLNNSQVATLVPMSLAFQCGILRATQANDGKSHRTVNEFPECHLKLYHTAHPASSVR